MTRVRKPRDRSLWSYNIRILLGNSYWLIVAPIAIAQLVFSWNLATAGLASLAKAVQNVEVLAPLLGALLCAYAVAPEQAGVGELVFVRPISLEKLLLLRLTAIFAFVLVLLIPPLVVYHFTVEGFPVGAAVLASVVSALFLSALAMAVASATRQPLIGLGVAGAFWAFDLILGTNFNPLLTLHGYSDYLAATQLADLWLYGKGLLLLLAVVLYLWNRRQLGRPAAPRRTLAIVRVAVAVTLLLFAYAYTGAACAVAYGLRHETQLGSQTWIWYRQAFQLYGPLPVSYLFGPVFPRYILSEPGRTTMMRPNDEEMKRHVARMQAALKRYPKSVWADNIAYELAHYTRLRPTRGHWTIVSTVTGQEPAVTAVDTNELGGAQQLWEFADHYPTSPFASLALQQRAAVGANLLDFSMALTSYQRVLKDYPHSRQVTEAGLALNALYLREGKLKDAVTAAKTAAEAATWDVAPTAYLTAAQTAQRAGDTTLAQECYRQARAAAEVSRSRAGSLMHEGGTKYTPARIIQEAESVMNAADRALRGQAPVLPPAAFPSGSRVSGQLLKDGRGIAGVRVALAQVPDGRGYPSPFTAGPAAQTTTDRDGRFHLEGLAPGRYDAFAVALPGSYRYAQLQGLRLPLTVAGPDTALPPFTLTQQAPPERHPPSAPAGRTTTRGTTRGGGRTSRGGRAAGADTSQESTRGPRETRSGPTRRSH